MDTAAIEIELLELLEDKGLMQFELIFHSLLEFWKHMPVNKYPKIILYALLLFYNHSSRIHI